MKRLGMPVSDTTILRSLKVHARPRSESSAVAAVHVAGVDDWAWRKGANYGTIIVDLERRQVVDVLADRSAATAANWFKEHPDVEVVSRDRAGLYAEAARQGAPQARQVADRFHLLQNFRETVERQLGRFEAPISDSQVDARDDQATPPLPARSDCPSDAVTQKRLMWRGRQAVRQELFDKIRTLFEGGSSVREIARKLDLGRRRVERWVRRIDLPDRNTMASKPSTPAYFGALLARRWAEGITKVRHLFDEIRRHGYTGSYSSGTFPRSLAQLRAFIRWRRAGACRAGGASTGPRTNIGSDDRSCDLAADRGGALRQTPWPDDRSAGRQRRCPEGGVGGLHRDAAPGDAVSRPASRWNAGEAGCLADRRTRVRHLRDAAFCEDDTPGPRCCSERCVGTVEQPVAGSQLAPRVKQTLPRWHLTQSSAKIRPGPAFSDGDWRSAPPWRAWRGPAGPRTRRLCATRSISPGRAAIPGPRDGGSSPGGNCPPARRGIGADRSRPPPRSSRSQATRRCKRRSKPPRLAPPTAGRRPSPRRAPIRWRGAP